MTMLNILGRIIGAVLVVVLALGLWLDTCAREARRRSRNP